MHERTRPLPRRHNHPREAHEPVALLAWGVWPGKHLLGGALSAPRS